MNTGNREHPNKKEINENMPRLRSGLKCSLFVPNAIQIRLPQPYHPIASCGCQRHSTHVPLHLPHLIAELNKDSMLLPPLLRKQNKVQQVVLGVSDGNFFLVLLCIILHIFVLFFHEIPMIKITAIIFCITSFQRQGFAPNSVKKQKGISIFLPDTTMFF